MSIPTVSLPTAQLLKEAGFPQDTSFYWSWSKQKKYILNQEIPGAIEEVSFLCHVDDYLKIKHYKTENPREWYAAPSTDEILAELPDKISHDNKIGFLIIRKRGKYFDVYYLRPNFILDRSFTDLILCEALAACWLWLKKEGLI